MEQNNKRISKCSKRIAAGLMVMTAIAVTGVCAASLIAGSEPVKADGFSRPLVASGVAGEPSCSQGSEWSSQGTSADFLCRASESAATVAQRTMQVSAAGHAIGSVVVRQDGFGTGQPVLVVKDGK